MMPETRRTSSAEEFGVAANEGQTPFGGFPYDFQELCNLGMGSAVEIQKTSLAAAVCLHSCAIDIYKNASCLAPEIGAYLDMAAKSFAICMELQSDLLTLMAPLSKAALCWGSMAEPTAEELAHHMDIACGHKDTVEGRAVAASSGTRTKPVAEEPDSDMDVVIGERVA